MRLVSLAFVTLFLAANVAFSAGQHNVVLIVADDLGLQLGCYGDGQAKTPSLDRLAAEGTRFTHAYCTTASCSASRSVILTGLFNHANGQYGHAHADGHFSAFDSVRSLPMILAESGYRTASVGKFHVAPESVFHFGQYLNGGTQGARNGVRMAENARQFIAAEGDKPFFLYFCTSDPHRGGKGFGNEASYPGTTPVKFDPEKMVIPAWLPAFPESRAEWADYLESVARMDEGVGALMKVLDETGRAADTLVIFVSDNGPPFPGAKTTLYEPGARLPLVVRRPGQKKGVACDALVNWTDLTPTILDWAGVKNVSGQFRKIEVGSGGPATGAAGDPAPKPPAETKPGKQPASPPEYKFHGRSFLGILDQEHPAGWDEIYLSHQFHELTMYYPMRAIVTRRHKLIFNIAHPLPFPFASDLYASKTWQAVLASNAAQYGARRTEQYLQRPRFELYDLSADLDEVKNLAGDPKQAETLKELQGKLQRFQQSTADPWATKWKYE